MKPFQPTTVNPNMMRKYTQHIAQVAVGSVVAIGVSAAITLSMTATDAKTADTLHMMQAERIDSLEAEVARLSEKLIDGAIIVIDCKEQATGRMTK